MLVGMELICMKNAEKKMATVPMLKGRQYVERPRNSKGIRLTGIVILGLVALAWAAVAIRPAPFAPVPGRAGEIAQVELPSGLPAPVERFYRQRFGERVPVIESAVISGRGTMRIPQLFNLRLPVRFRFLHEAGQSYRHYIEVTLFGLPALKVNEDYVDGNARQELPWAVATDNPKLDQGANLGMWAEIMEWLPSVLVTDPRVRWEAVDDDTALLVVPFDGQADHFLVRFSPTTGDILYWETMRYADGEGEKTLWINGTWFEDGSPWFMISEEDVVYNVDVDTSLSAKGP
jgi:hypothetical protein